MDFQREQVRKVQVSAAIVIGLLVGITAAPWGVLVEGRIGSLIFAMFYVAFGVYLALGFLILTSWLVDGYSRALNDYYLAEDWNKVGGMLGAPTGAIAAVVWVYNHSGAAEYIVFFLGGGLVGLCAGVLVAAIAVRLAL